MKKGLKKYLKPSLKVRKLKINFLFTSDLNDFDIFLASCPSDCRECGPSCFLAGTIVSTPDGGRPIESLRINDKVYSYNFTKKAVLTGRIKNTIRAEEKSFLVINGIIRVTPFHRFWTNGNKWEKAQHIKTGDSFLTEKGDKMMVESIETVERKVMVYNIHLHGIHKNYFANGVLVHNEKCN